MITLACHAMNFEGDRKSFAQSLENYGLKGPRSKLTDTYARTFLREDEELDEDLAEQRAETFLEDILHSVREEIAET